MLASLLIAGHTVTAFRPIHYRLSRHCPYSLRHTAAIPPEVPDEDNGLYKWVGSMQEGNERVKNAD